MGLIKAVPVTDFASLIFPATELYMRTAVYVCIGGILVHSEGNFICNFRMFAKMSKLFDNEKLAF